MEEKLISQHYIEARYSLESLRKRCSCCWALRPKAPIRDAARGPLYNIIDSHGGAKIGCASGPRDGAAESCLKRAHHLKLKATKVPEQ